LGPFAPELAPIPAVEAARVAPDVEVEAGRNKRA